MGKIRYKCIVPMCMKMQKSLGRHSGEYKKGGRYYSKWCRIHIRVKNRPPEFRQSGEVARGTE